MEQKRMINVQESVIYLKGVHPVGVIGEPGCEGPGTYNMKVYAGALEETAKDGVTLIAGEFT